MEGNGEHCSHSSTGGQSSGTRGPQPVSTRKSSLGYVPPLPPEFCLTTPHLLGGGGLTPPPLGPPPPKAIGQIFLRAFGQSNIFSGAFGASQFRPNNFFGALCGLVQAWLGRDDPLCIDADIRQAQPSPL